LFISIGLFLIKLSRRLAPRFSDLLLATMSRIGRSEGEGSLGIISAFTTLLLKLATTVLSDKGGRGVIVDWAIEGRSDCLLCGKGGSTVKPGLIFPLSKLYYL
jgi:hypothetical protein